MTRHECFGPEDLDALLEAHQGDPRRTEAEACPRCAANLALYARFLSPKTHAGANLDDARRRLRTFVEREFGGGPADEPHQVSGPKQRPVRPWAWWPRQLLGPVWAAAAIVVAIGAVALFRSQMGDGRDVLRGGPAPREGASGVIESFPAVALPSGSWQLRWRAAPNAVRYEVELLTVALEGSRRLPVGVDTTLALDRETLLDAGPAGEPLYWRVVAIGAGGEIAASPPRTLASP